MELEYATSITTNRDAKLSQSNPLHHNKLAEHIK